jgi:hypothetical protein
MRNHPQIAQFALVFCDFGWGLFADRNGSACIVGSVMAMA